MLLYSEQQISNPGKMHGMMITVVVMNKVLGRENDENGRRLCLGPAEVSEKLFHDLRCAKTSQKKKPCLHFMQTICPRFFSLKHSQNLSLVRWRCVDNVLYQY